MDAPKSSTSQCKEQINSQILQTTETQNQSPQDTSMHSSKENQASVTSQEQCIDEDLSQLSHVSKLPAITNTLEEESTHPGFVFWRSVLRRARLVVAPMVDASELPWRMLSRKYGELLTFDL